MGKGTCLSSHSEQELSTGAGPFCESCESEAGLQRRAPKALVALAILSGAVLVVELLVVVLDGLRVEPVGAAVVGSVIFA